MNKILGLLNGVIIAAVGGFSIFHDWQAWVLILWFVVAINIAVYTAQHSYSEEALRKLSGWD